ncbi:Sister chromatid cohesion protein PDS5 homolog E [Linum grandiflorum]
MKGKIFHCWVVKLAFHFFFFFSFFFFFLHSLYFLGRDDHIRYRHLQVFLNYGMSRIPSSPMKTYKLRGKNKAVAATISRNEGSLMKTYKRGNRGKNSMKKLAEAATSGHTEQQPPNEDGVIVNGTPPIVQQKRKRGADAEIAAQSYLSPSAKQESVTPSRFRPRKPVPVFRMVDLGDKDDNRIVGKRVKVYWSGSKRWFAGKIKSFNRRKKLHSVVYDDGDKEDLELRKERFELEILPNEDFNIVRGRRIVSEVKRAKGSDTEQEDNHGMVSADDDDDGNGVSNESEDGVVSKDGEDGSSEAESEDGKED